MWTIKRNAAILLLLIMGAAYGMAQDDFNPDNPPEPSAQQLTVYLSCSPEEAGWTEGEGTYQYGDAVTIRTGSNDAERYTFLYWTANGEVVSESADYSFTMGAEDLDIVAVYRDSQSYYVNLSCSPEEAAVPWFSWGDGHYQEGDEVTVNFNCGDSDRFEFQYWTLDGEIASYDMAYTFTVTGDVNVVAVFLDNNDPDTPFDPENPAEPNMPEEQEEGPFLYLQTNPEGAGSFDFESGSHVDAGTEVCITVTAYEDYTFTGWYNGEEMLSEITELYFVMPEEDVTLTAHFEYTPAPEPPYDPENPAEPGEQVIDDGSILHWGQDKPWQMRYVYQEVDEGMAPNDNWYSVDYDDDGWEVLTGPVDRSSCEHFGLGEGNYFDLTQEGSRLYLRRSFEIESLEELPEPLFFDLVADDRADVYLNGEFVGSNVDNGFEYRFFVEKSKFVEGSNLLAIYYQDESGEAYLDYRLIQGEEAEVSPYTDEQGVTYELNEEQTAWTVTGKNWDEGYSEITIANELFGTPVTIVGSNAFAGHSYISSITLPENLTTIETGAFGQTGISSIEIPASVTTINTFNGVPANPFYGCSNLASITVAEGNTVYSSPEGSNAIVETETQTLVVGCKETVTPEGVTRIGDAAFHDLEGLKSITIPASVTSIGEGAFWSEGCSSELRTVTVESTTPLDISSQGYDPFGGTPKYVLYVPVGTKSLYQGDEGWSQFEYILEIGEDDPETVVLRDGEPYEYYDYTYASKVKYIRSFSSKVKGNYQCWFVPFDYTVTEEDAKNFQFYKIHMIAGSSEPGMVEDMSKIYIYIVEVLSGETLKGNRPYVVKPLNVLTDYEFEMQDVELMPIEEDSRMHLETAETAFDFYGIYSTHKPSASNECKSLNTQGQIAWIPSTATLKAYRWWMSITPKEDMADYSNTTFILVDENGDTLSISSPDAGKMSDMEGIYTTDGLRLNAPARGMNIVKMRDGSVKKVMIK